MGSTEFNLSAGYVLRKSFRELYCVQELLRPHYGLSGKYRRRNLKIYSTTVASIKFECFNCICIPLISQRNASPSEKETLQN